MVLVTLGILTASATPLFIGYYQGARLKVAAETLATFLNQGRQLGIKENAGACVHRSSTTLHSYLGTAVAGACPGAPVATLTMPAAITVTGSVNPITFDYLGAVIAPTSYLLTNAQDGRSLLVTVAITGRISIKAP